MYCIWIFNNKLDFNQETSFYYNTLSALCSMSYCWMPLCWEVWHHFCLLGTFWHFQKIVFPSPLYSSSHLFLDNFPYFLSFFLSFLCVVFSLFLCLSLSPFLYISILLFLSISFLFSPFFLYLCLTFPLNLSPSQSLNLSL